MEPFDYPDNDPGPQTLLTSLTPDQNIDRLHWLMSRFQGYVGIVSYMGARFTVVRAVAGAGAARDRQARADLRRRRRLAAQRRRPDRRRQNLPFAKTDVVLDAVPTPVEIDRALARLEMAAREHGMRGRPRHRAAGDRRAHRRMGERRWKAAASCWCRSPWWR